MNYLLRLKPYYLIVREAKLTPVFAQSVSVTLTLKFENVTFDFMT